MKTKLTTIAAATALIAAPMFASANSVTLEHTIDGNTEIGTSVNLGAGFSVGGAAVDGDDGGTYKLKGGHYNQLTDQIAIASSVEVKTNDMSSFGYSVDGDVIYQASQVVSLIGSLGYEEHNGSGMARYTANTYGAGAAYNTQVGTFATSYTFNDGTLGGKDAGADRGDSRSNEYEVKYTMNEFSGGWTPFISYTHENYVDGGASNDDSVKVGVSLRF